MSRSWVAIQRNPKSGAGPRRKELLDLVNHLRRHGIRPRLFSRRERLIEILKGPGRRGDPVCIVAAGGDGTVSDVLNRFPGRPIAILPLGTENLVARHLGIPRSGRLVAKMIATGQTRRFDLGLLGERRFVIMASLGFDADVIHRLHARRGGHITKFSYLQPILQSLRKYGYPPMRLFLDGADTPLSARLAVIVNLPVYALGLPVAKSALGDDGLLDLRLFQRGSAFQMVRYVCKVAVGTHEKLADVRSVQARRVRIESDQPVPIQVDGDPAGWTPVEIGLLPRALEVFVPTEDENETSPHEAS